MKRDGLNSFRNMESGKNGETEGQPEETIASFLPLNAVTVLALGLRPETMIRDRKEAIQLV